MLIYALKKLKSNIMVYDYIFAILRGLLKL